MQIVSVIRDSFQEYEGYQSLVLFSGGCNYRCYGCYNLKMILEGNVVGEAVDIIEACLTPMHEAVVFLGGEPTIWGESLVSSARKATEKGMRVKLYTNGSNPSVVKDMADLGLLHAVSVDVKTVENCGDFLGIDIDDETYLGSLIDTIDYIRNSGIELEIRTTNFPEKIDVEKVVSFVRKNFPGVKHIIQRDFMPYL